MWISCWLHESYRPPSHRTFAIKISSAHRFVPSLSCVRVRFFLHSLYCIVSTSAQCFVNFVSTSHLARNDAFLTQMKFNGTNWINVYPRATLMHGALAPREGRGELCVTVPRRICVRSPSRQTKPNLHIMNKIDWLVIWKSSWICPSACNAGYGYGSRRTVTT